jgi:formylglycine-generating enzyme required for sulfatase activity
MAPEQIDGEKVAGPADQFSLAVLAFRLLSGRFPFEATSDLGILLKIRNDPPASLRAANARIPAAVERTIHRALAKAPEERFASCSEFAAALGAAVSGEAESGEEMTRLSFSVPAAVTKEKPKKKPRPVALWVFAAALVLGGGGYAFYRIGDTPARPDVPPHSTRLTQGSAPSDPRAPYVNPKDGLTYLWIEPGNFEMGCSEGDAECLVNEKPTHRVTISKAFRIGQTPVTQAAFEKIAGANPSIFRGDRLPVEGVDWADADKYCRAVDMRLPTEAEWEYAARAGNASGRYGDIDRIAWFDANSGKKTHEAMLKAPNAWGLYDMLGNVAQWTSDVYADAYSEEEQTDPRGPDSGTLRVLRGGAWGYEARTVRVSSRFGERPEVRYGYIGFRCVGNAVSMPVR